MRVVCLIASFCRGRSGSLVIQQIIASMSWLGFGAFCGRQIMSPRDTSTSSSSRTVTDIGGKASSISVSNRSIAAIVEVIPDWQHQHLVAGLEHPAGDPPGVSAVVVEVVGLRPDDVLHREPGVDQVAVARPRARSRGGACSDGPSYQSMCSDRVTTLSPLSAEIGMI